MTDHHSRSTERPDRSSRGGRGRGDGPPPKPRLDRERPRLPRDVYRDLKAASREGLLDEVAAAYAQSGRALEEGRVEDALALLRWAKWGASRSAAVREALGVALYLDEQYDQARMELQTYRRMTGRADQNHLLADCVRAQGRHDKVEEYVGEMLDAGLEPERVAEGVMVLAGARADRGDLAGALAAVGTVDLARTEPGPTQLRVWYLEAQLHRQLDDPSSERRCLERVARIDPDYLDTRARLTALRSDPPDGA